MIDLGLKMLLMECFANVTSELGHVFSLAAEFPSPLKVLIVSSVVFIKILEVKG